MKTILVNELRLGNWVSIKGVLNGEVRSISSKKISIKGKSGYFPINDVKGIPLTKKTLTELGFIFNENSTLDPTFDYMFLSCLGWNLTWHPKDAVLEWQAFNHLVNHGYPTNNINIEFVHELQNLYFIIEKKEIELLDLVNTKLTSKNQSLGLRLNFI